MDSSSSARSGEIHITDGPDAIFLTSADADVYPDTEILTSADADADI